MLKITINKQSNGHSMNVSTHTKSIVNYLLQALALFCFLSTTALANTNPAEASQNAITSVQYNTLPGKNCT